MVYYHSPAAAAGNPRMGLSIILTLAFVVGKAVAGYFSHSLALMSNAMQHDLPTSSFTNDERHSRDDQQGFNQTQENTDQP